MSVDKEILDPMCGGRMMWYDKNNPHALFLDNRELHCELCDGRMFAVSPDVVHDIRSLAADIGGQKRNGLCS